MAITTTLVFLSLKPRVSPSLSLPSTDYHQNVTRSTFLKIQTSIPKIPSAIAAASRNNCPVPLEQQPINEYQALSTSFPFSWATGDLVEYCSRLCVTGLSFALFVGLPVCWFGSVGLKAEPVRILLASFSSGLVLVILAVVRMYLGWAYVGNRLLSATIEYEETGWYDGQMWVKTAQVLARDRLLGSFSVKPVLGRLKNTLVVLGTSLLVCILVFLNSKSTTKNIYIIPPQEPGGRAVPGVYNDESARNFEPDAFCGEPAIE